MILTEMQHRELTSLRDKLRHRLRVQLSESSTGTASADEKRTLEVNINWIRDMIGDAYRSDDLYTLRAYATLPNHMILDYRYRTAIKATIVVLREAEAVPILESLNADHVEAYIRVTPVLHAAMSRYDDEAQSAAMAYILSNLEHEDLILDIVRERRIIDPAVIRELLPEMQRSVAALREGAL